MAAGRLVPLGPLGPAVHPTASVRTVWDPASGPAAETAAVGADHQLRAGEQRRSSCGGASTPAGSSPASATSPLAVGCPPGTFGVLLELGYRRLMLPGRAAGDGAVAAATGVLYREGPPLAGSASPMVVAGLLDPDPVDGVPPIVRAVQQAGRGDGDGRAWLEQYLEVSLRPLTRLLVRHGIALEAHTQNSLVALDDGWPVRFVVRDLEGASLNRDHPRAPGGHFGGVVDADSPAVYDEPEVWRRFAYYGLVNHLGQLIATLAEHLGPSEGELWAVAGAVLTRRGRCAHGTDPAAAPLRRAPRRCRASGQGQPHQRAGGPQRAPRLGRRPQPAAGPGPSVTAPRCRGRPVKPPTCPRCGGGSCASSSSRWSTRGRSAPTPRRGVAAGDVRYRWSARRRFSFDRVRLGPGPVLRSAAGAAPVEATRPGLFLDEIGPALRADPERRRGFAAELERTVANDTQARRHWRAAGRRAAGAAFDDLESLVVDGHPYHPSYKSRLGFDAGRQRRLRPRVRPADPPRPGRRSGAIWSQWRALPGVEPDVVDGRVVLPVHPWQWERHARRRGPRWSPTGRSSRSAPPTTTTGRSSRSGRWPTSPGPGRRR